MPANVYTVGQRITYTFSGGTPGSVLYVILPGAVAAVSAGANPNVTVQLDNGFPPFNVPASDGNLKPA